MILTWNLRKKLFPDNFSEILCKPRLSSTETCEMPPYFLQFYSGSILHLKKFTQVLSYVVCTKVRRHVHKQITKKEDTERKSQNVLFSENQCCLLSVWDLLRQTPWVFWYEIFTRHFLTVSIEFWMRFEPQIHPARLAINFLFVTAKAERKVRLCVKLFDFFRG